MDDTGASTTGWGNAPSNAPNAMKPSKFRALSVRDFPLIRGSDILVRAAVMFKLSFQ